MIWKNRYNFIRYLINVNVPQIVWLLSLCCVFFESASKVNGEDVLCIANGAKAAPGQIPYQVALKKYHENNGLYLTFCGGSIISDRKVLSAAHCFFYKEPSEYCDRLCTPRKKLQLNKLYAVAGTVINKVHYRSDNTSGAEQWRRMTNTHMPNSYDFPKEDIAIAVALKKYHENNGLYLTFCGGSIISDRKVLSAAHCFFYKEPSEYCDRLCTPRKKLQLNKLYAVAGTVINKVHYRSDNTSGAEQWRRMTNTHMPNSYDFPKEDIAIAITSEPFVFSLYVSALPYATQQTDYGAIECAASGYGRVSVSKKSEYLLWANFTLLPNKECTKLHGRNMDDFICTKSVRNEVMAGDSGGPLVCRNTGDPSEGRSGVIVGVVSGVRQSSGTFFTRVSNYREFIETLSSCSTRSAAGFCIILLKIVEIAISFLFYFVRYRIKNK